MKRKNAIKIRKEIDIWGRIRVYKTSKNEMDDIMYVMDVFFYHILGRNWNENERTE